MIYLFVQGFFLDLAAYQVILLTHYNVLNTLNEVNFLTEDRFYFRNFEIFVEPNYFITGHTHYLFILYFESIYEFGTRKILILRDIMWFNSNPRIIRFDNFHEIAWLLMTFDGEKSHSEALYVFFCHCLSFIDNHCTFIVVPFDN